MYNNDIPNVDQLKYTYLRYCNIRKSKYCFRKEFWRKTTKFSKKKVCSRSLRRCRVE